MQRAWLTRLRVDGYSGHSTTQTRHTSSETRFKRSTNRCSCTVDLHPSPCNAGRGCRRRVRGDEADSNELCTVPPTPKMRVGRSQASRLSPSCLRPPSPPLCGKKRKLQRWGRMHCIRKRVPRQRSFDGDALAAKLGEARASHNGTRVVAVAVSPDPAGRCCGIDHACSVARDSQRPRQRAWPNRPEVRAGSHRGVNACCLAHQCVAVYDEVPVTSMKTGLE